MAIQWNNFKWQSDVWRRKFMTIFKKKQLLIDIIREFHWLSLTCNLRYEYLHVLQLIMHMSFYCIDQVTDIPVSHQATIDSADNTIPLFSISIGNWQNHCLPALSMLTTLDINTLNVWFFSERSTGLFKLFNILLVMECNSQTIVHIFSQ